MRLRKQHTSRLPKRLFRHRMTGGTACLTMHINSLCSQWDRPPGLSSHFGSLSDRAIRLRRLLTRAASA
jgi:hypothetical protein